MYQILAIFTLLLHLSLVVFVVGGLLFIVLGSLRSWPLASSLRFRLAHLTAIAIVVAQAWLGAVCPLTTLEMWLRTKARTTTYEGPFIEYWLQRLLYYEGPSWFFTLVYSLFGLAVVAAWWRFPPVSRAS